MGSEKFCLRWNDFESNISTAFRELRDDKDFFDVTLACNGDQIQAHKVILSACSPFFRNILRRNPHQHPLLYLKGVKYTDLQSVLNFMYHGEVNVAQEELNSFLAVAEELSVKGLTQNQSAAQTTKNESSSYSAPKAQIIKPLISHPPDREPPPPPKRSRPLPTAAVPTNNHTVDDDDIQEVVPVKSEPRDPPPPPTQSLPPPAPQPMFSQHQQQQQSHTLAQADDDQALAYPDDSYEDYGQYGDEQDYQGGLAGMSGMGNHPVATGVEGTEGHRQKLNECIIKTEEFGVVGFKCLLCGKTTQRKDALTNHIENIHFPGSYQCHYCEQVFNSQNTRNVHIGRKHKFNSTSPFKV